MPTPWLRFGDHALCLEQLPGLLERGGLLQPLIRRLILEFAIRDVPVSSEEQTSYHRKFLTSQGISTAEELQAWLAKKDLTEDQASSNIVEKLAVEKFKASMFDSKIDQTFFDSKDLRDKVVYSLLRVHDRNAALELHLMLQDGDATFTELCEQHSVGPERESGGLIGPVLLGRLHVKLAEIFRLSRPGRLWPPIQIDDFWVIVRLDKKIPAELDAKMRQSIRDELFEAWISEKLESFMESYRAYRQTS